MAGGSLLLKVELVWLESGCRPTFRMTLKPAENVPLAPLTTLGIGGPARFFINAKSEEDVFAGLEHSRVNALPVFILGGGSNILVSDEGFDGLVIQVGLKGVEANDNIVTAASGEDWDGFVEHCVANDLAGVECLSGIPGFVGGTPVQNVGAYGQEVSETIIAVRCFDRENSRIVTLKNDQCGFTYRTSIFNTTERDRYVVLSVTYQLVSGGRPKLAYRDLIERFGDTAQTLDEVRDAVINIRKEKSMVIDASDPNSRSAGSFFKNPIVDTEKLDAITGQMGKVPFFEFGDKFKVPAAWLIEKAGFCKGYEYANVGLSAHHVLAIINRGGGTAREVLELKDTIQNKVNDLFGIVLSPEPLFIGFNN